MTGFLKHLEICDISNYLQISINIEYVAVRLQISDIIVESL